MAAFPTPPTTRPVPPPPPGRSRRVRRVAGPILIVGVLVAAAVAVAIGLDRPDEGRVPPIADPGFEVPVVDVAPGSAVPKVAVAPDGVREWAAALSEKTEIPSRSLVAYAEAEVAMRTTKPGCNVSWATLAGVGRVESHHGRYGGSRIEESGQLSPPIFGVALDGSPGVRAIPDTDGGRLDGDQQWDRAVGAMQFLPTTWSRWAARSGGDGAAPDPQDIDDAALTAARYLCASGGDLSSAAGWWRAVLTYNESVSYGRDVFSGADAYAKAAG